MCIQNDFKYGKGTVRNRELVTPSCLLPLSRLWNYNALVLLLAFISLSNWIKFKHLALILAKSSTHIQNWRLARELWALLEYSFFEGQERSWEYRLRNECQVVQSCWRNVFTAFQVNGCWVLGSDMGKRESPVSYGHLVHIPNFHTPYESIKVWVS